MSRIYYFAWTQKQPSSPPETAHTHSKRTEMPLLLRLVLALALAFPTSALALPTEGQISAGTGGISQSGNTLTVTQTSPKLAINWQNFSIGQNETVNFTQPNSSTIALNRVLGQNPSQILGNLTANGQVFILNPNGVLFGSTAQVNVGGLVASTLSLNNADFMADNLTFSNNGTAGSVVNQGSLAATNGGYIAMLAPEARNEGIIVATLATALLAAGDKVTLNLNNGSLLSYTIDQGTLNALAENKHLIQADGGQVILSAQAANTLTSSVVNNDGIIEAHTIENQAGVITLLGDMQTGQVKVSGTLDASGRNRGETGGTVKVLGDRVALLDSAHIDVSGNAGGGTALVGGNFQGKGPEQNASATFVAQGTQLNANALTNGNGGKVILWADGTMRAFGSISARGGTQGGNGGFIEVSGKQSLGFDAAVDTSASNGKTGSLLLDPLYAIISSNPDGVAGDTQTINATSLGTNLNSTDITVQADTKVTVDAAVNASANANVHNLALDTPTIDLNAAIMLKTGGVLSGTAGTVNVNSPTASIQNGVDVAASGSTVNVAAGTYMLNTRLDVNKPLTLRGAQHGVDPRNAAALRTAGSGAETIVDGNNTLPTLLRIGGNNVTVDGFEFRNGIGDLIDSTAVISAPEIRYNLIHHSADPGDEGIQIRNSTGAILEYNRVYDTGIGDGLNFDNATNGTIRFNEVHDNSSVNAAIYVYGSTNTTIQGNYVHDVHAKEGIKLGDSGGADKDLSGGSIINNIVENTFSDGITIYTSDVTVSGNQVSNSRSLDGAIFVYYNVDNIAIENNTISNNGVTSDGGITYAIRIGSGTKYPTNVTVTGNTFSNNEAQFFDNNGAGQIPTIFGANTFDRSAMVSGDNRIWSNIQDGITVAASGNTVTVGVGTYSEAVNISTDSVTLKLTGNTTINSLAASAASTSVNLQNFKLTAGDDSTTTYSGIIGGTGSLTKTGSGTLTLSGNNSYSGGTTINGGTLSISADNNLGAAPGAPTPSSLTLDNGTLQTTDDVALDMNRGIALTGAGVFDTATATTLNISGIIDGAGTLTKTGSGTLTLSGINTYTGATTINAGTLSLSGDGADGDSNLGAVPGATTPGHLTLNNGTLQTTANVTLDANRGSNLTGPGVFDTAVATRLRISGDITGAGTLTKVGMGTLTLTHSNTYTGATTINAGKLLIVNDSGLGTAPGTATPGHLTFDGGRLEIQNLDSVVLHANRGITLMAGGGEIDTATDNTTTYAGIIAGSGTLSKGLDGTLELSGANSYTGLTTVSDGTLRLAGGAAIPDTGAVNLSTSGSMLRLLANETIGSLTGIAGTSVILQNNSTLTTGDAGNTTFAGVMSGAGGNLSKQGAGTFTLSGLNTYTGLTTVNQGTLAYGISNALDAGAITVNNGTLDIGTFSDTVAAVTLVNGSITGTTGVLTGTSYGVQSGTISAKLAGTGALSKTTDGTMTLSGTNTYTGATTVTAGTLVAANAAALGATAGSTTVTNGATLEIANVAIGNETVTLNGTGIGENGALIGSGTASLSGPITLATASALGAATGNALTLSGTIEGAGALNVLGGGTVTLGNTVGNNTALASFSGATGTALAVNGSLIKTSGAQTYSGTTTFGGATTLRTTAGGSISAPGTMTATAGTLTLDTGAGDATFTNNGNDFSTVTATSGKNISFVDANALAIAGIAATGMVDVRTQTGDLTLNNAIATTSTSANAVTLIADAAATPNATGSGGNFKNPGSAAITTGDGGAWQIYSGNPTGTSRGGLAEGGKRYNVDDGSDPLAAGNRLYFRIQPTLTLTAEDKTKTYGDANPTFSYSYAGLIDNDLLGGAISSGPSYTVDGSTSTSGQLTADTPHNIIPNAIATNLGYSLGYANGALTVNQKSLTISVTGANKVYDGGLGATVTYADNRVAGDLLTIGSGTAAYLNKNVGTGKNVNVTDITLTNMDAGNYTFNTTAATTADIIARTLTITATGVNKTYDGGFGATVTYADNRIAGDVLTIGGTAAYLDKNVGTGKSVNVSGITLTNMDAGNYTFNTTAATTADILARALAISATGMNKVYDGGLGATVTYADNRIAGDVLTIGGTAAYLDKNVGTGKSVNVSGITLTNMDAGNYTFNTTAATTADIIARALTISATGVNKVYDGGTGATVTYADNRVVGDLLTINGTAAYLDKNVGTGKSVNVSGITLTNMDADNYTFNTTAATIADITAANLAITGVTAANKVYDGTMTATLLGTGAITALGDDAVSLGGSGSGIFADKNVALGKAVTVSGYSISGADADNYSLLQPTGLTADITARPLTITATGIAKVYDGTTGAIVSYTDNRIAGDLLTISGTAAYLDKNVGTGMTVNVSSITLGNMDAGNYSIINTTAVTTADIIARALRIAANDATKYYTGISFMGGNGVTYAGFANGETSAVLDGTLAYGGTSQGATNAGSYLITPSGLTADNYSITYTDGVLTVKPAPAAGGMLPAVAEAVVTLPGEGANLLTAFHAARTAAITPVTPVLVPSSILDIFEPQNTGVSIDNNHSVEQVNSLTLVNGGVKLPTYTKISDGEKEKSDANKSGE